MSITCISVYDIIHNELGWQFVPGGSQINWQ